MQFNHNRQASYALGWTLCFIVFATGCPGGAGLPPAESEVKKYVEDKGGMVETEDGHITVVWLENADLADSDLQRFATLPELRELHLNYNRNLTNDSLAIIEKIPKLQVFEMTESQITNRFADEFRKRHPEMSVSGPGA